MLCKVCKPGVAPLRVIWPNDQRDQGVGEKFGAPRDSWRSGDPHPAPRQPNRKPESPASGIVPGSETMQTIHKSQKLAVCLSSLSFVRAVSYLLAPDDVTLRPCLGLFIVTWALATHPAGSPKSRALPRGTLLSRGFTTSDPGFDHKFDAVKDTPGWLL